MHGLIALRPRKCPEDERTDEQQMGSRLVTSLEMKSAFRESGFDLCQSDGAAGFVYSFGIDPLDSYELNLFRCHGERCVCVCARTCTVIFSPANRECDLYWQANHHSSLSAART